MLKKRGSSTRAKLFLLLWLLLTQGILFVGEFLGGLVGAWATPQLFFVALGGISHGIVAPWALGVLLAMVLVTVLVAATWIIVEQYAKPPLPVEAPSVPNLVKVPPVSHLVDTSFVPSWVEVPSVRPEEVRSAVSKGEFHETNENKLQPNFMMVPVTPTPNQSVITSPSLKSETPPTPVYSEFNNVSTDTPPMEADQTIAIDSPYQPEKNQEVSPVRPLIETSSARVLVEVFSVRPEEVRSTVSKDESHETNENKLQPNFMMVPVTSTPNQSVDISPSLKSETPPTPVYSEFNNVSTDTPPMEADQTIAIDSPYQPEKNQEVSSVHTLIETSSARVLVEVFSIRPEEVRITVSKDESPQEYTSEVVDDFEETQDNETLNSDPPTPVCSEFDDLSMGALPLQTSLPVERPLSPLSSVLQPSNHQFSPPLFYPTKRLFVGEAESNENKENNSLNEGRDDVSKTSVLNSSSKTPVRFSLSPTKSPETPVFGLSPVNVNSSSPLTP